MKTEKNESPSDAASGYDCPECGNPMKEQPRFKGLWLCEVVKCEGVHITKKGSLAFYAEMKRQAAERN